MADTGIRQWGGGRLYWRGGIFQRRRNVFNIGGADFVKLLTGGGGGGGAVPYDGGGGGGGGGAVPYDGRGGGGVQSLTTGGGGVQSVYDGGGGVQSLTTGGGRSIRRPPHL